MEKYKCKCFSVPISLNFNEKNPSWHQQSYARIHADDQAVQLSSVQYGTLGNVKLQVCVSTGDCTFPW